MLDCFKKDCLICFATGAVAGILGLKLVKTDKARKLAVQTIAHGMMAKDCAMEEVANLREEAEEICNEARAVAKAKSDCDCDCDCGCDCDSEEAE
ncbi:DUF6110 family protein [Bengtsoniella intestinalis]|uniref:DUF6110 family protein n=1 Tax=Bengtsoniella intestinalis TaxID=3073143 RepID=UPI00391F8721